MRNVRLVHLQETHSPAGYPVDIAAVTAGTRGRPKFMWRCGCSGCRSRPFPESFRGFFESESAARQASDQLSIAFHDRPGH
jgi:hypothetical protein